MRPTHNPDQSGTLPGEAACLTRAEPPGDRPSAVPGVPAVQDLADRMWELADRWETRADELSERRMLRHILYGFHRPQLSAHYRLQASGLRAELRAAGYERQAAGYERQAVQR